MPPVIEVKDLTFEYPAHRALDKVSFKIDAGTITALVGPNGAGKSTLMRCIAALAKPLSGSIHVNGVDVIEHPRDTHRYLGYLSDFFGLYADLSVQQSLHHSARLRGMSGSEAQAGVDFVCQTLQIENLYARKLNQLSRGQRQRIGIAQAIIHQPKLVLLDEPASGLDPEARHGLSELLIQLNKKGMSLIVSSHILSELEDYSSEMLIIRQGKILEHSTISGKNTFAGKRFILKSSDSYDKIFPVLAAVEKVSDISKKNDIELEFTYFGEQESLAGLLKTLVMNDISVSELAEVKVNLQDEYIKKISGK